MAIYRALRPLTHGAKVGSLTTLDHLDAAGVAKLIEVGAVARVAAPPIHVIPEWKDRSNILLQHGIKDFEQLLEADEDDLATKCTVDGETIRRWKSEAESLLVVQAKSTREY